MDTNFISRFLKELSNEGAMTIKSCSQNLGISMELTKAFLAFLIRENILNDTKIDFDPCKDGSLCKFCPYANLQCNKTSNNRYEMTSKAIDLLEM